MNDTDKANITAVVPVYNRSALIGETLESLLQQYLPFSEIIVVDDGSNDGITEAVKKFDGRIRLIKTSNRGVQHARNTGADLARTEWITFSDSDDLLLPNYTETLSKFIIDNNEFDLIFTRFETFTEETLNNIRETIHGTNKGFSRLKDDIFNDLLQRQFLWPTGMCIRRQAFNDIGGYDSRFRGVGSEDLEFTVRAILALRSAISKTPLALVRRHSSNDSRDFSRQHLGEAIILLYLLKSQPSLEVYRWRIMQSIYNRLIPVLGAAWAQGDFPVFMEASTRIPLHKHSPSTLLQRLIVSSPQIIRDTLWRIIRRRHHN